MEGSNLLPSKTPQTTGSLNAQEKAELVLEGLRGDKSIADLCRGAGISRHTFVKWRDAFLEGGRKHLDRLSDPATIDSIIDDDLLQKTIGAFPANLLISRPQDGKILFRSAATQATFGIRKDTREHWASQEARQEFIKELQANGRVDNMFFIGRRFDGTEFPAQLSSRLIEHGDTAISVTTSTDLTRFYAMSEETERANARFNEALEAFDEGFVLWDSDLCLVLENQRMFNMLYPEDGPPRVAQPGDHFELVLTEQFANGVYRLPEGVPPQQIIELWMQMMKSHVKNMDIELGDGRCLSGSSHKTEYGGYLLTFKDVTEERQARKAQREADTLLRLIVDACPANFMVSRVEDGKIIYRSNASMARFGEIESARNFFLKPEDRLKYLDALLPTGVVDDYSVKFRRSDGSIMDGLTSARVTNYGGEEVIVSSTRDVTEYLNLQAELQHQREIAHQNEKLSAMGELLAGVAHELNNPLSVVVGYSLMLQEKLDDPVHKKRIERIGQSAERCARIVKTFLAMARQRPAILEQCSLNDVVEMAFDLAGYDARAKGTRIVFDLDSTLPMVDADSDQLVQVFSNLITNATHALSDKRHEGVLTLKTYFDEKLQLVVAEVVDNGIGISTEDQVRIFEPFFTTKEAGDGTGIGLAFCYRIIDTHGGRLSVKSRPGRGARFIVRMKQSERSVTFPSARHHSQLSHQPKRILVIDDEADVAQLMCDIFEDEGHSVEKLYGASAALDQLQSVTFDAVFCDIKMPGIGGEEFWDQLIADNPEQAQRTAFVSGDILSPGVARFLERTGVPHLEKPVVPAELIKLLEKLCNNDGEQNFD